MHHTIFFYYGFFRWSINYKNMRWQLNGITSVSVQHPLDIQQKRSSTTLHKHFS